MLRVCLISCTLVLGTLTSKPDEYKPSQGRRTVVSLDQQFLDQTKKESNELHYLGAQIAEMEKSINSLIKIEEYYHGKNTGTPTTKSHTSYRAGHRNEDHEALASKNEYQTQLLLENFYRLRERVERLGSHLQSLGRLVVDLHLANDSLLREHLDYSGGGKPSNIPLGQHNTTLVVPVISPPLPLISALFNHKDPLENLGDLYVGLSKNSKKPEYTCGVPAASAVTSGGNKVRRGEYPWITLIIVPTVTKFPLECSGTIISHHLILTAAHCVRDEVIDKGKYIKIIVGDDEFEKSTRYTATFSDVTIHHDYISTEKVQSNDIALINVDVGIYFSEFVRPICLPTNAQNYKNAEALSVGQWGQSDKQNPVTWAVRKGWVLLDNKDCLPKQLCSSSIKGKTHVCEGNSGGPLMIEKGDRFYIIGIVSHILSDYPNSQCDDKHATEVFTNVSEYVRWIFSIANSKYID